jgi:GT2 family glycosyltransferase
VGDAPAQRAALPISTITVGYGGQAHLRRLLASLLASSPPPAEVIVVDNASPLPLRPAFDAFKGPAEAAGIRPLFIEAGSNLGFGGGNRVGIAHATQEWVMLLNPDTEVEPSTLALTLEAARNLPQPCAVQPLLLFSERRDTINSAGIATYIDGSFVDMLCEAPASALTADGPIEIVAPTGACALFPRELPDRCGFFDPDFFLYFEDVDLGLRWRRKGVHAFLVPAARMFHVWHGSTGPVRGDLAVEIFRNQLRTVLKNYPPFDALLACLLWAGVTVSYLGWRRRSDDGWNRVKAAASVLREAPRLRAKRREVRALGPDTLVSKWIVMPRLPHTAHPPQVR